MVAVGEAVGVTEAVGLPVKVELKVGEAVAVGLAGVNEATSTLVSGIPTVPFSAAVAVKLGSRGPVLFRQNRVGKGGLEFSIVKFRRIPLDIGRDRGG